MHQKRLEGRIINSVGRAIRDFGLIKDGDRILVAMSGGKDSYGLLWVLQKLRAAAPISFDLVLYHLDQGQPGHDTAPIRGFMESTGLPHEIEYQDTYSRVLELTEPGKIYCSVCSRFRRAIVYRAAVRQGCNKVALGHHRDDLIETLLLNIFFSGQLKSMPPRLVSQKGTEELIRPLCYVPEEELAELSQVHTFPVVPCKLCGSIEAQRVFVKRLLDELSQKHRHLKGNILNALSNVKPTHLLDRSLNPLYGDSAAVPVDEESDDDCGDAAPAPQSSVLPLVAS
jgi:tRNA 2-thiocytidine biosynthesis protein TtcA